MFKCWSTHQSLHWMDKNYSPQKYHHFLLPSHTLLCIHQSWERVHVRVSSHKTSAGFEAWSSLSHLILIAHRWHGDQDVVAVGGREEVCRRDQTPWAVYSEPCVGDLSELVSQLDSSKAPFLPVGRARLPKWMVSPLIVGKRPKKPCIKV